MDIEAGQIYQLKKGWKQDGENRKVYLLINQVNSSDSYEGWVEAFLVSLIEDNWKPDQDLLGPLDVFFDEKESGVNSAIVIATDVSTVALFKSLRKKATLVGSLPIDNLNKLLARKFSCFGGDLYSGTIWEPGDPRVTRKSEERKMINFLMPTEYDFVWHEAHELGECGIDDCGCHEEYEDYEPEECIEEESCECSECRPVEALELSLEQQINFLKAMLHTYSLLS